MMLKILEIGDPILRQKARELSVEEILSPAIQQLIVDMKETMHKAPGTGLAAPQVGKALQLILIEDKKEYIQHLSAQQIAERHRIVVPFHVLINPKISIEESETAEFYEKCLSVPAWGIVPRAFAVRVECLNEKAEPCTIKAKGWYARVLQHEIDHLNGVLCLDRMRLETFTTVENYAKYWKK